MTLHPQVGTTGRKPSNGESDVYVLAPAPCMLGESVLQLVGSGAKLLND